MTNAFAIVHTWPEVRNAEYEVIQRVLAAAENVGRRAIVIDNNGKVIWAHPETDAVVGEFLARHAADFMLTLHFESPRVTDLYSYYAIWQPIDFYFDFGYQGSVDKVCTHQDLLSCDSDLADAHALNLFKGAGGAPASPLPKLFHTLPEPFLEPAVDAGSKLFYIGINWERIGRPKGRFHDTLVALDRRGLIEIYGPEKMFGVAPWEDFASYRGELPFDGQSVKRAINRSGICLALSSNSHRLAGIMSNRLFEGLAGGAAIVATRNPLIDKYFSEVVYPVDDSRGEDHLGQMIVEAVHEIRSDPAAARARVREGQRILRETCSLEGSLCSLFEANADRVEHFRQNRLAHAEVTVVLMDDYGSLPQILDRLAELRGQVMAAIDLVIVCDRASARQLARNPPDTGGGVRSISVQAIDYHPATARFEGLPLPPARSGPALNAALRDVRTPFVMLLGTDEMLFHDHIASLARTLRDAPAAAAACSGALAQAGDPTGPRTRTLNSLRFADQDAVVMVSGETDRGRFLYRAEVTRSDATPLLSLLDGEEHRYFQLRAMLGGGLAQSSYATFIRDRATGLAPRRPAECREFQHQFIRDLFVRDERWLAMYAAALARTGPEPREPAAMPPLLGARAVIEAGVLYPTRVGGTGLAFLVNGFSQAEKTHIWITAERATLDFGVPAEVGRGDEDYDLILVALGRRSKDSGRDQHCGVIVNGLYIAYLRLPSSENEVRIRLPRNLVTRTRALRVELVPDHNELADATGDVEDPRRLSIMLLAFGIATERPDDLPLLMPGTVYSCGAGQPAAGALTRGFYAAEPTLTWLAGREAWVRFRLGFVPERAALHLGLWGRRSLDGHGQSVSIVLNGELLATLPLEDRQDVVHVPLPPDLVRGGELHMQLVARHAEAVFDNNGDLIDGRLLGLALTQLGVMGLAQEPRDPVHDDG